MEPEGYCGLSGMQYIPNCGFWSSHVEVDEYMSDIHMWSDTVMTRDPMTRGPCPCGVPAIRTVAHMEVSTN